MDGYEKIQVPWQDAADVLYNLKEDPKQEHDLSQKYPDLMKEFRKEMMEYFEEMGADDETLKYWL